MSSQRERARSQESPEVQPRRYDQQTVGRPSKLEREVFECGVTILNTMGECSKEERYTIGSLPFVESTLMTNLGQSTELSASQLTQDSK